MPIQRFYDLFHRWDDNQRLSVKYIHLKAITLLALTFMLWPSDVAPRAVTVNADLQTEQFVFDIDKITFHNSGHMSICFHGNKNDYQQEGSVEDSCRLAS
jgi:hypothetical protein